MYTLFAVFMFVLYVVDICMCSNFGLSGVLLLYFESEMGVEIGGLKFNVNFFTRTLNYFCFTEMGIRVRKMD